jgi:nucleotide-binding universal stress UspA family protein
VVPYNVVARSAPRRFLLAVDGEPFTLGEFAGAARHLLTALGAEVTVLHVVAEAEVPNAQALDTVERTGLLADLAPAHTRIVVNADPAAAIVAAAHPDDFDAVVVVARSRSVLGRLFHHSVTAQVVLHSALPVLVLPAQ